MNTQNQKLFKSLSIEILRLNAEINWKTAQEYDTALAYKDRDYMLKSFDKLNKKIIDLGERINSLADNGKYILPSELAEVYKDEDFIDELDDATEDMYEAMEECKKSYTAYLKFLDLDLGVA